MQETFEEIKKIVLEYENNLISSENALESINKLSNIQVDKVWLDSYWNSMDLNEFARLISIPPIENWSQLTDMDSLKLISEIIDNISDSAITRRNMVALEKRYSKPVGTISNWIFYKDICDPEEILRQLKVDTSIAL